MYSDIKHIIPENLPASSIIKVFGIYIYSRWLAD